MWEGAFEQETIQASETVVTISYRAIISNSTFTLTEKEFFMSVSVKELMATMGTGPRSSDPLTYKQARAAMAQILGNDVKPATFGGFMVAERWKGQEPEELAGFLDEIRSRNEVRYSPERSDYLDIAGRFDGKSKSVNTDLASSILTAAAGVAVFTHAGQKVPTQQATTLIDVIGALKWNIHPSQKQVETALDEFGFAYAHQEDYAPQLAALRSQRADLGVRCFLNTIESMANPANASIHVGSFYHLPFAKRVCDTFERLETDSPEKIVMIQGIEGQTELRPGVSVIGLRNGDEFQDQEIRAKEFNLNFQRGELEPDASPSYSAQLLRDFFNQSTPGPYQKSVLLNATVKLWASGQFDNHNQAKKRAMESLETGEAKQFFQSLEGRFSR